MTGKSDRELLELAAKAIGIKEEDPYGLGVEYFLRPEYEFQEWNPLFDDGDAFRLALALKMDFIFSHERIESVFVNSRQFAEDTKDDAPAAARRAIVRAAAAIGEKMP